MRELRIVVTFFVLALSATSFAQVREAPTIYSVDPTTPGCRADDVPCRDWLLFRRITSGPYQSLAIATRPGRATVIISEPPARRAEFLALVDATFGSDLIGRSYRRWATGLDGWLEDLVLDVRVRDSRAARVISGHDLAPWSAPAQIVDRLLFLYAGLYGTTDGFWVDNINAFPNRVATASISEPTVAPADLLDWLTDPNRTWTDVTGAAQPVAFRAMDALRSPNVYVRSDRALVAFVVPSKTLLSALTEPFRRFAIASDLLLGGYQSKSGTTWMIGRARQAPLTALPPLRFETLASFVRDRTTELMQSYERKRIFAGRVTSGPFAGWDWAPILLSSQLDDSEFGTLLNQADQILKSWSQAGAVDYYSFAHAKPSAFPFAEEPASRYFARRLGTTSLVFNWNTQAFSTIHQLDQGDLISIDRFGALPILYLPSGSILDGPQGGRADALRRPFGEQQPKAESLSRDAAVTARQYFAQRGDPILVRVAQNVLLYQVTQAFLGAVVTPSVPKETARWEVVSRILREEATAWLRGVAAPGPTPGMSPAAEAALERAIRSDLTVEQLAETIATPQATSARLAGLSARFQRQAAHREELVPRHHAAVEAYHSAFTDLCAAVRGTIRTTPAVAPGGGLGGRTCDYSSANLGLGATAQRRLDAADATTKAYRLEIETIDKSLDTSRVELNSLYEASKKADALAKLLSGEAAITAQLDRILARVRAGVASDPRGSIRTPALVLSRNTDDEGAIGGHNITFDPARIRISPPSIAPAGRGRGAAPAIAARPNIRPLDAAPAAEPATALKATRSGSLLDEMRIAQNTTLDASMLPRLAHDAATCACDALVVQTSEGEIFFARNAPPPIQRRLSGSTGIVDALAGPPRANVVRFDGFDESSDLVESIVGSTELALDAAASETTRLTRLTDLAAKLFRTPDAGSSNGRITLFSYLRRGRQPEVLRFASLPAESVGSLMIRRVPWRTATVTAGEVRTLESGGRATSTYVRFRTGAGATTNQSIGIEVQMERGRTAVSPQNLATVAKTSLAGAGPGSTTMADGLMLLRESIQRQLSPAEINFLLGAGATPLRISQLRTDAPEAGAE